MSALRELIVDIDFNDIDIAKLTQIDRQIDDIEDALQSLGGEINSASAEFSVMGAAAEAALNDVTDEARDTERAISQIGQQNITPNGTAGLLAQLAAIQMASGAAGNNINSNMGGASSAVTSLGGSFQTAALKANLLGAAGVSALGLIIAAAAPVISAVGGIAASLLAAGVGVGAYAAVAVPALGKVFTSVTEITAAEAELANADTYEERIAAQEELAALYDDMSKAQRGAVEELQEFKSYFGEFAAEFEEPVFEAFEESLIFVQKLLDSLKPAISGVSTVVVDMMQKLNGAMDGEAMKSFFDWIATTAGPSLSNWGKIGGNAIGGILSMLQAFGPTASEVETGLIGMTEKFQTWAEGLGESEGFKAFIDYAKENGPVLMDTLENIALIAGDLIEAFAPMGTDVLANLESFTGFISDLTGKLDEWQQKMEEVTEPIGGLDGAVQLLVGPVGWLISGLEQMNGKWGELKTKAEELTAPVGGIGNALLLLSGPIGWIIGIGMLLYNNWDQIKAKALEIWDSVGGLQGVFSMLGGVFGAVIAFGIGLYNNWEQVKGKAIELAASAGNSFNQLKTTISTAITTAKTIVVTMVTAMVTTALMYVNNFKTGVSNAFNAAKTAISNAMGSAKTAVSNFFSPLLGFIERAKGAWSSFTGALKSFKMPAIKFPSIPAGIAKFLPGHATGLERVPYDDYTARLHKDEAVLTATQSNALRDAGVLSADGAGKPQVDLTPIERSGGDSITAAATTSKPGNTAPVFSPRITVQVNGAGADARTVADMAAEAAKRELEKFWQQMILKQA